MEPVTVLLVSLLLWLGRVKGDIRCYCNDASCISTAYMCKSTSGKCYSKVPYEGDTGRSAHGCVESLPPEDRTICEADGDIIKTRSGDHEWPILICCTDDMCNYRDTLDIKIFVNTKSTGGNVMKDETPHQRGTSLSTREGSDEQQYSVSESYSQRVLWFKAAVIAVPIAGGFILILLVLLAVRMLRNDSRRHRQLMQMRRHRSLTKAQLYVADHFYCEKNDKHGHWNAMDKRNTIYKDVNVKVDYNGHGYEKFSDSSQHGGSCSSIIVWGKPGKAEPTLTVV